jgi:hypothetical protein
MMYKALGTRPLRASSLRESPTGRQREASRRRERSAQHWLNVFLIRSTSEQRWGAGQLSLECIDGGLAVLDSRARWSTLRARSAPRSAAGPPGVGCDEDAVGRLNLQAASPGVGPLWQAVSRWRTTTLGRGSWHSSKRRSWSRSLRNTPRNWEIFAYEHARRQIVRRPFR